MPKAVAVVPAGASVSNGLRLGEMLIGHLIVPAALDAGITQLSFDVALEDDALDVPTTWIAKYVAGAEFLLPVASSRCYAFNPADWFANHWVRVRLGTHASPVTISADATFYLGLG